MAPFPHLPLVHHRPRGLPLASRPPGTADPGTDEHQLGKLHRLGRLGNPQRPRHPRFSDAATHDDIRAHNHILTPGRYVGAAEVEDVGEPFDEKMERLTAELRRQMEQASELDTRIWAVA